MENKIPAAVIVVAGIFVSFSIRTAWRSTRHRQILPALLSLAWFFIPHYSKDYYMMPDHISRFIPRHREGKQNDISHQREFDSQEEARDCFLKAYKRLLHPTVWHALGGTLSAEVSLRDPEGKEEHRMARVNDHYRIDIPGPGTASGKGYDWVRVDAIEDHRDPGAAEEWVGLRLRPCESPVSGSEDVAHFFTDDSTSNFIVRREGGTVIASYHGRNEMPNNSTSSLIDNVRNSIVTSGAMAGLSEAQWSALVKALLQDDV